MDIKESWLTQKRLVKSKWSYETEPLDFPLDFFLDDFEIHELIAPDSLQEFGIKKNKYRSIDDDWEISAYAN